MIHEKNHEKIILLSFGYFCFSQSLEQKPIPHSPSDSTWVSHSHICLYNVRSIVTAAYFSHLSMSVMWLSYASVPVLQWVERMASMGIVRGTVQDMKASHVFVREGWVISTCTLPHWVTQQEGVPAESLWGTFTKEGNVNEKGNSFLEEVSLQLSG